MDEKSLQRNLALLVFVASAMAAFSLGALAYTFATGALPFGLHSMIESKAKSDDKAIAEAAKPKAQVQAPDGDNGMRLDEEYLASFANELKKEKEKLAAERSAIDEQRKEAENAMEQAKKMQDEVAAKEKQVSDLLKKTDVKERANVQDMQKLISGMDVANATNMLLSLDETLAARILAGMNKKLSAQIVAEAMKDSKKGNAAKIKSVTMKIQTLSDELKGEDVK